jgi:hypothetical protein
MEIFVGRDHPFVFTAVGCSIRVVVLTLPQLAFALLAGFCARKLSSLLGRSVGRSA